MRPKVLLLRVFLTEPLPSNNMPDRHTNALADGRAYVPCPGSIICVPSFIEIGSGIRKLIRGDRQAAWFSQEPTFVYGNRGDMDKTTMKKAYGIRCSETSKEVRREVLTAAALWLELGGRRFETR
jgi:hypothetical protein